jgi:hypothetical protein
MIVYRDGGSDGSLDTIRGQEVEAAREAICELNRSCKTFECPNNCEPRNCEACKPRITFIVAQNDHNMRIVPANERDAFKNNVPIGTLVDGSITSYESLDGSFDFLLTPQGGLKGTSKPMHYKVILNENSRAPAGYERDASGLTKEHLHEMTYFMAFQCKFLIVMLDVRSGWSLTQSTILKDGTATKAPRKVPVLLNSEKLSNRVIKYGGCKFRL